MAQSIPYRELPISGKYPPSSAWGVFGDDDQVGTINWLNPTSVIEAAALVKKGSVFSLNWDLEQPDPPLSGRRPLIHAIHKNAIGTDDYYDVFYTQRSSQWDALCHIQHPEYGFYNGCSLEEITGTPGSRNGIDNWARRGIVGRFVLIDIARKREREGRPLGNEETEAIGAQELEECLSFQNVRLTPGSVLLLRFGWMASYLASDDAARTWQARPPEEIGIPGLSAAESSAEWLWDNRVAAVATDSPALESLPVDASRVDRFLHYRLIAMLGMAIGEMFFLEELASDCADDGRYEGMFTAAPLNKVGGSGSPANALAMK
jgi:kynurenine formamidase